MKKRIGAIVLLIGYIALLVFLTIQGLPDKTEYKEKYSVSENERDK